MSGEKPVESIDFGDEFTDGGIKIIQINPILSNVRRRIRRINSFGN